MIRNLRNGAYCEARLLWGAPVLEGLYHVVLNSWVPLNDQQGCVIVEFRVVSCRFAMSTVLQYWLHLLIERNIIVSSFKLTRWWMHVITHSSSIKKAVTWNESRYAIHHDASHPFFVFATVFITFFSARQPWAEFIWKIIERGYRSCFEDCVVRRARQIGDGPWNNDYCRTTCCATHKVYCYVNFR